MRREALGLVRVGVISLISFFFWWVGFFFLVEIKSIYDFFPFCLCVSLSSV